MGYQHANYTMMPNILLDNLHDMENPELRVMLFAIRQTIGFHRATRIISLSAFERGTGLTRKTIITGIKAAIERGVLKQVGYGQNGATAYEVVFDEPGQGFHHQDDEKDSQEDVNSTSVVESLPEGSGKIPPHIKKGLLKIKDKEKIKDKDSQPSAENPENQSDVRSESTHPVPAIPEAQTEPSSIPEAVLEPDTSAVPDEKELNRRAAELIHVWLDRQDALNDAAYKNTVIRGIMRTLVERGVYPIILQRFIRLRKQDDFWRDKFISADHIAKNVLSWMKADPVCQQLAAQGYAPYITVAQQAELDAQKPKPLTEADLEADFDPADYGMTPEELAENMARKEKVLAELAAKLGAKQWS